jgi:hypothetical protein
MRTLSWVVLGLVAAAALYAGGALLLPLDRARALEEFAGLERHLAAHYANLDWMVSHRRVDLRTLDRATRARLESAWLRVQAQSAIRAFVAAFNDPHLRANWPEPAEAAKDRAEGGLTCAGLGYENRDVSFRLPFDDAPGWQPYAGAPFPSGRVATVGVVRIGHFGEDGYRAVCDDVGVGRDARDTKLRVRGALQHKLRGTLEAFASTGVTTVLVDVTGNGGGTEWAEEAARLFTAGPLVRLSPVLAAPTCDRTAIWQGAAVCPVLPALEPLGLDGLGGWTGPVVIVADRKSGSATEDFIVRLRESGVARLVGERTAGAGCGYVDGGAPFTMTHIGLVVRPPNCARYTREGMNEIEGLAPDRVVAISQLAREDAAAAVLAAIRATP